MNSDTKVLIGLLGFFLLIGVLVGKGIQVGHEVTMARISNGFVPQVLPGTATVRWVPGNCEEQEVK